MSARNIRVLAFDPTTRGFGFTVMEGPRSLIDWGVKGSRRHETLQLLQLVDALAAAYEPDVIVVERFSDGGPRRGERAHAFVQSVGRLAERRRIRIHTITKAQIRAAFAASRARTKQHIATVLAARFRELAPRLPPPRKPWTSEDYRMSIFDAVALAIALFESRKLKVRAEETCRAPAVIRQHQRPSEEIIQR